MGNALLKNYVFEVEVLCYDIKEHVGDAKQVSLKELQQKQMC
jgi:D-3-phosphoglycerate dehydrogenase